MKTAQEYFNMYRSYVVNADMDLSEILTQLYVTMTEDMWKTIDYKTMKAEEIRSHFDSYNKIWNEFAEIFEKEVKSLPGLIKRDFFIQLLEKELRMDFKKEGLA